MRIRLLTILLLCGVGACSEGQAPADRSSSGTAQAPLEAQQMRVAAPAGAAAPASSAPATSPKVALPQIAYTYTYAIELPAKAVVPMFERHRRACEAAGPTRCQLIGAETATVRRTDTRATLTLRAETGWLTAFRARLSGEADAARGRIAESTTASEDLGRAISDSGARLRALTTLRDRLQNLLATRTGKLGDLLEIERELARVEGELDATRSALADMGGRVTLPQATIVYRPDSLAVAGAEARGWGLSGDLLTVATTSFALLLNLAAAVLPWAIVVGVPLWLLLRWRRRRKLDADRDAL